MLNKVIEIKKEELKQHKNKISSLELELLKLENIKEITTPGLYKKLGGITELESNNIFELRLTNTTYEHILGGDGRGSAWSEERNGTLLEISCVYWLSDEQKTIAENYFKTLKKINKFKWNI